MNARDEAAALKAAELLSATGAALLGGGFALVLPRSIEVYAAPLLVIGAGLHALGMYQRHRIETGRSKARLWWVEALYWSCWIGLAVLLLFVVARAF